MSAYTQRILGKRNSPERSPSDISLEEFMDASEKGIQSLNDAETIDGELSQIYALKEEEVPVEEEFHGTHIEPDDTDQEELNAVLKMAYSLSEKEGYNLQVMPSLESMSLERTRELIRLFLETTRRLIVKLWHVVDDYWESYLLRLTGLVQVSLRLKDEVARLEGRPLKKGKLTSEKYNYLSTFHVNGNALRTFSEIHAAFNALVDEGGSILNQWSSESVRAGIQVIDLLEHTTPETVEQDLINCNQITKTLFEGMPSKLRDGTTFMSGVRLGYVAPDDTPLGETPTQQAAHLMGQKFELETIVDSPEEPITFSVFTLHEINELMDMIVTLGNVLRDNVRQNRLPRLSANSRHLMNQSIRRFNTPNLPADESQYAGKVNLVYRYAYAYGQWVRSPAMPLSSLLVTVSRNVQSLCREMLTLY